MMDVFLVREWEMELKFNMPELVVARRLEREIREEELHLDLPRKEKKNDQILICEKLVVVVVVVVVVGGAK